MTQEDYKKTGFYYKASFFLLIVVLLFLIVFGFIIISIRTEISSTSIVISKLGTRISLLEPIEEDTGTSVEDNEETREGKVIEVKEANLRFTLPDTYTFKDEIPFKEAIRGFKYKGPYNLPQTNEN